MEPPAPARVLTVDGEGRAMRQMSRVLGSSAATCHVLKSAARLASLTTVAFASVAAAAPATTPRTMADVIAATTSADWRPLDPENTLYLQLPQGRVVIELAPAFAPQHVVNLKTLAREKYFDGLRIVRSQDNFVVQWGDGEGKRSLGTARKTLPPEFTVKLTSGLPFEPLPDRDGYAPEAGFSQGFPAGRDPARGEAWLAHCYGMVGAGRGNESDSGNGAELYVVTGHSPRQLDRNIALVGRVVQGIDLLATQPRGTGPMGFYETPGQGAEIASVRVAADVPAAERASLEAMRTDTERFRQLVEARRNRRDDWYLVPAGYIDLCNVPLVVRPRP